MSLRSRIFLFASLAAVCLGAGPAPGQSAQRPAPRTVLAAEGIDYTPIGSANAIEGFKERKRGKPVRKPSP